jgi:hypothetical protein
VPVLYLAGVYGLLGWCVSLLAQDIAHGLLLHGVFTLTNTAFLLYAVVRFVGLRASLADLRLSVAGSSRWPAALGSPQSAKRTAGSTASAVGYPSPCESMEGHGATAQAARQ